MMFSIGKSGTIPANLNFSLPLIGREQEVTQLLTAYSRILERSDKETSSYQSELVLIQGESGTGKSSLIDTLRHEGAVEKGRCCLVAGKFNELSSPKPYSALSDALADLCESLCKRDDLDIVQKALQESMGEQDPAILSNILPNFGRIVGEHDYSTRLSFRREFGFERLKKALNLFLAAVCSDSYPVVLFIDDLQWADESSLAIIESLLFDEPAIKGLLLVSAYRDNEIGESHHLQNLLERVRTAGDAVNTTEIHLSNLDVDTLNHLVASVTQLDAVATESLAQVVYQKTRGNPFFSIQFLRMLQDENLLYLSPMTFKCDYNLDRIQNETSLADNVVDFMAKKLDRLPESCKDMLKVASCLGLHFDAKLVAAILDQEVLRAEQSANGNAGIPEESAREALVLAADEGLIEETVEPFVYRFCHDRIRQGSYALLSDEEERSALHLRIGRILKRQLDGNTEGCDDLMLLLITDQLIMGSTFIKDDAEKLALAKQCVEAADCVGKSSAFFPAAAYLRHGLSLVPGESKWTEHYNLMLQTCSLLAEMAYCCGDFELCRQMVEGVEKNVQSLSEKLRVQFILVRAQVSDGDMDEAIDIGLDILNQLGIHCPKKPSKLRLTIECALMDRKLQSLSEKDVFALPRVTDATIMLSAEMIRQIAVYAWQAGRMELVLALTYRSLYFCLRHGTNAASPEMLVACGIMSAIHGNWTRASELGKVAMKLIAKEDIMSPPIIRALIMKLGFLDFTQPVQDSINPLLLLHDMSMEAGDLQDAAMSSVVYTVHYMFSGLPLSPLCADLSMFITQLTRYQQHAQVSICRIYRQCILNFMGDNDNPVVLIGNAMDQEEMLKFLGETHNNVAILVLRNVRMTLAYFFRDFDLAGKMLDLIFSEPLQLVGRNSHVMLCYFFAGLTAIALSEKTKRRRYKMRARKIIKLFEKMVSVGAVNCHHMLLLLYAEVASTKENDSEIVRRAFDKAIASASRSGFVHHAALANERVGMFFLGRKDNEWGEFYLRRACQLYMEWGAIAKVNQLRELYAFLSHVRDDVSGLNRRSCFVKGRARFNRDNTAKHNGELLREFLRGSQNSRSGESLAARQILESSMKVVDLDRFKTH